jgi:hypothetical protein
MRNVGVTRNWVSALFSFSLQMQLNSFPGVLEGFIYGDAISNAVGIMGKIT